MQEDGFDAADYVRVGEKRWMPGLSYDLKFDKTKGENDKIFIDNEITIAEKKKSSLFSWNCRILWRNKRKGFVFNNPNATRTCGCGESFSL
jgi:iron-sulfur cluster assembly protein